MNHGPDLTLTPIICLRLMQWNTKGISGKITELLTFLHSNNVNIAAIQETKMTNKTKPKNGRSTLPDISLASIDIALLSDWSNSTSLASDHLPICITINSELSPIDGHLRTYINFTKADWAPYAEACDKYHAEACETKTAEQAEKISRKAVNNVSGLFILAGRIRHFQPTLLSSAKSLADDRDRKRRLNPAVETLNDQNKQIQRLVVEDMRTYWQSAIDKCEHRPGISYLWWLAKGLTGKKPHNKAFRFADTT